MIDLSKVISEAWESDLRAARSPRSPRAYVYASGRRECTLAMALDRLYPDDEPAPDGNGLERMERGVERERSVIARLIRIGERSNPSFNVIEGQQRFEIKDRDGKIIIVGKIDGRLSVRGEKARPPFEIKSGRSFEHIDSLDDFARNKWTRHAPDQLLAYLYATDEPHGYFILERAGMPKILRVSLEENLERVEAFMAQARIATDATPETVDSIPFAENTALCLACPHFGKHCSPPMDFGKGAQIVDDPEIVAALEIQQSQLAAAKDWAAADKIIKERFRGVEHAISGNYMIRGKWKQATRYDVPDEVKQQYKRIEPHGTFSLEIEKVYTG